MGSVAPLLVDTCSAAAVAHAWWCVATWLDGDVRRYPDPQAIGSLAKDGWLARATRPNWYVGLAKQILGNNVWASLGKSRQV